MNYITHEIIRAVLMSLVGVETVLIVLYNTGLLQ